MRSVGLSMEKIIARGNLVEGGTFKTAPGPKRLLPGERRAVSGRAGVNNRVSERQLVC